MVIHKKTAAVLCLALNEDKMVFSRILEAIMASFNISLMNTKKVGWWGYGFQISTKNKGHGKTSCQPAAQRILT